MNEIITLDGVKTRLQSGDLNRDGISGGVEVIQQTFDQGIQPVIQPTELGDTLKELNRDELEPGTRMTEMDMKARLHSTEIMFINMFDSLVMLGVLPTQCLAVTRQKKRLSVSVNGLGRREFVEVVAGKKDQDAKLSGGGIGSSIKGFMGMNQ